MRQYSLLLIAALLAGCGGDGETYQIATRDVKSKLLGVEPPDWVFGDGKGVDTTTSQIGQDQVRWTVRGDGTSMLKFTATVAPDGDSASKVSLVLELADGQQPDQVRHNIATTSAAMGLYQAAMVEAIEARLENRSFNTAAIQSQMAASMGTNFKQVDASLDDAVKNFDAQGRARDERLARERVAREEREAKAALEGTDPSPRDGGGE